MFLNHEGNDVDSRADHGSDAGGREPDQPHLSREAGAHSVTVHNADRPSKRIGPATRHLESVPLVTPGAATEHRPMRTAPLLLGLSLAAPLYSRETRADSPAPLTIERIVSRSPSWFGTSPTSPAWSPDGKLLAFLWNDQAMPAREVWLVERDGSGLRRLTHATEGGGSAVTEFAWANGAVVYLSKGLLHRLPTAGGSPEALLTRDGERAGLSVSPDGKTIAYVQEGDLWLLPLSGGPPVQATHVGVKAIGQIPLGTYYHPDVEIGSADWGENSAYAWAPDSKSIAVHYVDRRNVRRFPIPYYLTPNAILNELRRGAPGDVNEVRTVGVLDVATRELRLLDLPNPSGSRILGFAWSQRGPLLIDRETDNSVDRTLTVFDPETRALRDVWTDHGPSRIYNEVAAAWHPDGIHILLTGDLDERYRLYLLNPGDSQPKVMTQGPYDIEGAAIAPPNSPFIYYVSSEPRPEERHVWRIPDRRRKTRAGQPARRPQHSLCLSRWERRRVAPQRRSSSDGALRRRTRGHTFPAARVRTHRLGQRPLRKLQREHCRRRPCMCEFLNRPNSTAPRNTRSSLDPSTPTPSGTGGMTAGKGSCNCSCSAVTFWCSSTRAEAPATAGSSARSSSRNGEARTSTTTKTPSAS